MILSSLIATAIDPTLINTIASDTAAEASAPSVFGLEWYIITLLKIILVFFLIALNGFFVAAEFAIVNIRSTQLDPYLKKGDKRAKTAQFIIHHINPFLNTTQVGITLASLGLGWIGEPVFASILEPFMELAGIHNAALKHTLAFAIGFSVITFLHITLGECTPKTLAIFKPLDSTLHISRPLRLFNFLFYPVIWMLDKSSIWMLKQVGLKSLDETEHSHSEDELKLLLSGTNRKSLAGRNIVLNALDLKHRLVREVMTPRREISYFSTDYTIEECLRIAESTRYSRFPLCEKGNLDRILGIIHIKDLYAMRHKAKYGSELKMLAKKTLFVPGSAHLEKLLFRLMDNKIHFATIVDEYGGPIGILTQENILEELVGQIQDEFDQEQTLIQYSDTDNEWILAGNLPIHQLEEITNYQFKEDPPSTVAGLVVQTLGSFPEVGQNIIFDQWILTVKYVTGKRIDTLTLKPLPSKKETNE